MSDQRGRGARGGGPRGGGGAPRGRGRGGDYGSRGGGQGRGDFGSRGRGDSGSRGRGDFGSRGGNDGRGRGRGGGFGGGRPDPFEGDMVVYGQGNAPPNPDPEVTRLENGVIGKQIPASLTARMGQLSIQQGAQGDNFFPCRPAFGNKGTEVTVWANYFRLTIEPRNQVFAKYSIQVVRVEDPNEPQSKPKAKGKGKSGSSGGPSNEPPKEVKGKKLKTVIHLALQQLGSKVPYATEYKSQVVSLRPLDLPDDKTIRVEHQEEGRANVDRFEVKFSGPNAISISALIAYLESMQDPADPQGQSFPKFEETIDAIGVVLGHTPRSSADVAAVGKGRFFPTNLSREIGVLGDAKLLRIIRGFFQSVRPATGRLLLNANVTHGIFRPSGRLPDILDNSQLGCMHEASKMKEWEARNLFDNLARLSKILSRARIRCQIKGKDGKPVFVEKTIAGFAQSTDVTKDDKQHSPQFQGTFRFGNPYQVRFWLRPSQAPIPGLPSGDYCVVGHYFKQRYNLNLDNRYPLVNTGTPSNPIYYPAEFCEILPGQSVKGKLSADQSRDMINFACRSPFKNATSISSNGRQVLGLGPPPNPLLKSFGISVGGQLITVKARQLDSPMVTYNSKQGKKNISTDSGTWNMRDVKLVKPGRRINKWTWICIRDHRLREQPADIRRVVQKFSEFITGAMGVNMHPVPLHLDGVLIDPRRGSCEADIDDVLEKLAKRGQLPEWALVILPAENNTEPYNALKYLADCKYGFHTNGVVSKKFLKDDLSYFANVALKVNLKFEGINHHLRDELGLLREGRTMVVGWDVIHPTNLGSDQEGLPSQVGLVASVDKYLAHWPSVYWNQDSGLEMLDEQLTNNFASRLQLWYNKNKAYPSNIIIYRDGVSEGQFKQVLDIELPRIRKACQQKHPRGEHPRISIIVSVKRHQTRFYPSRQERDMPRSRNIKNGTVVDRGVTQATLWEFFLTAHTALQGTAKPARYVVLLDEIFRALKGPEAANELEKLTHDMCYLFGRATKAVSICPPAYYADILCTRARVHMAGVFDGSASGSVISTHAETEILNRRVHDNLRDSMYYI